VTLIILRTISYSTESQVITQRNRSITVEHLNPILTEEEISQQRQSIEDGLFNIFEKYEDNRENRIAN